MQSSQGKACRWDRAQQGDPPQPVGRSSLAAPLQTLKSRQDSQARGGEPGSGRSVTETAKQRAPREGRASPQRGSREQASFPSSQTEGATSVNPGCVPAKSPQSCPTLRPYGLQPARLLCPWDSPGTSAGAGGRAFPQGTFPTQDQAQASHVSCTGERLFTAAPPGSPRSRGESRTASLQSRCELHNRPA